jgi:hypothetical protein
VRGEEDRELTFKVRDDVRGSGTVTGVRDDDGDTADGVEAEGGVGNGVGDGNGAVPREAIEAPREAALMARCRGRRWRRGRETWVA